MNLISPHCEFMDTNQSYASVALSAPVSLTYPRQFRAHDVRTPKITR
jgi:hypothetical protein